MKDKLLQVVSVILFGLLLFGVIVPRVNAWAAVQGSNTVVCEPGALVSKLDNGGLKVVGQCEFVSAPSVSPDAELEPVRVGDALPSESYQSAYPNPSDPEPDSCDWIWYVLGICEE